MTIKIERGYGLDFLELEVVYELSMDQYRVDLVDYSWSVTDFSWETDGAQVTKKITKTPAAYGLTIEKAVDQWLLDAGLIGGLRNRYE